jgi:hypothetical protein
VARRGTILAIALIAAAVHTATLRADSNLIVGVGEDNLMGRPAQTIAVARDLGVRAFRLSLVWEPGRTHLSPAARAGLDNAVVAAGGTRLVLAIYGEGGLAPLSPADRSNYCTYARNVLEQYPQINDVVIWNEPNLAYYWWKQFNADETSAAPADYEALLAHCWDLLHAFRPGVNLIGPVVSLWGNDNPEALSNISHSPLSFIRKLGEAYRASGRARPILDTFGHHPHPASADERPWKRHDASVYVSLGDWGKLMNALTEAFEGTAQPIPGEGPSIWWLEVGYQTLVDEDKKHLYRGTESWRGAVPAFVGGEPDFPAPSAESPAPDQATQLIDSVRLSYCQPYVEAFFNFLLWDEPQLGRWQSGVLWADGSPKGSYQGFKRAIAEANDRRVDCSRMKGGGPFIQPIVGSASDPIVPRPQGRAAGVWGTRGTSAAVWDDLGPILRPSTTSLPSGFFAEATPSQLEYRGTRRGPFGFVMLRGRLTTAGRPVAGKNVTIVAGGSVYSATTDGDGVATMLPTPPVAAGTWTVAVSFLGDPEIRPASTEAKVVVLNTRARVAGAAKLRTSGRAGGSFRVSYDGRRVKGRVRFRASGLDLRASRITALGIGKRGRSAWFTGFNRKGERFWANAQDNDRYGQRDRFRLWVGRSLRIAAGRLQSSDIRIKKARTRRS